MPPLKSCPQFLNRNGFTCFLRCSLARSSYIRRREGMGPDLDQRDQRYYNRKYNESDVDYGGVN